MATASASRQSETITVVAIDSAPKLPDALIKLLGDNPEQLVGYGSSRVYRARGIVAKVGAGAAAEQHVLAGTVGRIPLAVPRLIAAGEGFVVMEEVATIERGCHGSEREHLLLLRDLAALHDAFFDTPVERRGPLGMPLREYIGHMATYGNRADVTLPATLAAALADLGPVLEVLAGGAETLVHGDPYRGNVREPVRGIRVWIDWEDAVFTSPAIDLAGWFLDGPWRQARSLDRGRALEVYMAARRVPVDRAELERSLDAATVAVTVSQNLSDLAREGSLQAFFDERLEALDRLGLVGHGR